MSSAVRPVVAVGVGSDGRVAVGQLNLSATVHPTTVHQTTVHPTVIPLSDSDGPEKWRDAVSEARRHFGSSLASHPAEPLNVLLVGNEAEVRRFWNRVEHLAGDVGKIRKIALQLGDTPSSGIPPSGCYGWFYWTRRYVQGDLTVEQSRDLSAYGLSHGLVHDLLTFAIQCRPDSAVVVGAAYAWLPEITIGTAVARYLVDQAAQALAHPQPTAVRPRPPLFSANSLDALGERLRRVILDQGRRFAWRLFGEFWKTPLPDLDDDLPFGSFTVIEMAEVWVRGYHDSISRQLAAEFENASSLAAAAIRLREAIRRIESIKSQLLARIDSLTSSTRLAAQKAMAADRQRLAAHRRRLPMRLVIAVWRTLLTFVFLRRFLRTACEQQVARLHVQSLERLQARLTDFETRIARLFAEADRRTATLRELLEPNHPCLVPLHTPAVIEALIENFAATLLFANGRTVLDGLLSVAGQEILADHSQRSPWEQLHAVANRLAGSSDQMSQTLDRLCSQLLPQYRPRQLDNLLCQVSEPRSDSGSFPWVPVVVRNLAGSLSSAECDVREAFFFRLPIALSFKWSLKPDAQAKENFSKGNSSLARQGSIAN